MTDIVQRARAFAIGAHTAIGQRRKYTGEPYWHHPQMMVGLLASAEFFDQVTRSVATSIAWLHDVMEDCTSRSVSMVRMRTLLITEFGPNIADGVRDLTNPTVSELARCPFYVQTVKVADIIDNCSTLRERDPDKADAYFAKKRAQLDVMTKADPRLVAIAMGIIG